MTTTTPEELDQEASATTAAIAAAEGQIAEAEAAIERGDDVAEDRVPALERHLRHLKVRLRGLGRRRDEAVTDRRLGELEQLRAEIETGVDDESAPHIAALGVTAYAGLVEFLAEVEAHNQRHARWFQALRDLGVGGFGGAIVPPPSTAGLGLAGQSIAIGRRRVELVDVAAVATAVADAAKAVANGGTAPAAEDVPVLAGIEASLSREVADLSDDMRFFKHEGTGALHSFGTDYLARSPQVLNGMTELNREEWTRAQWTSAG